MFLPTTADEMRRLGWDEVDVVLVSGDAYVDSPYSGIAVIGQVLLKAGFRVAVLSQPPTGDPAAFREFGPPRLFWGISAGCVDSMVANYTASGKRRRQDCYSAHCHLSLMNERMPSARNTTSGSTAPSTGGHHPFFATTMHPIVRP